jgi:hypothetical protein
MGYNVEIDVIVVKHMTDNLQDAAARYLGVIYLAKIHHQHNIVTLINI